MIDHQGLKVGQTVLFQVKKTLMWGVIVALLDRGLIKVWTSLGLVWVAQADAVIPDDEIP
jgi:hypothetical protein